MAIQILSLGYTPAQGVAYTVVTDTFADWAGVTNSTYFYDKGDKLIHYKNAGGVILEIFSADGGFIPLAGTEVGSPITGDLEFHGEHVKLYSKEEYQTSHISLHKDNVELLVEEIDTDNGIETISYTAFLLEAGEGGGQIEVRSTFANFKGIEYAQDYSANFIDRSLVDKAYVDNIKIILGVPSYANDASALSGGLVTGNLYKTTTGGITALNIVP